MNANQHVLDWRLCHGSKYRYEHLELVTGLTRRQLYRMRHTTKFGHQGLFTYGESLALLCAHVARINVREHTHVIRELASWLDHAGVENFNAHIVEHSDGTLTAHVSGTVWSHDAIITHTINLGALAMSLANAHARLHNHTE